jgi:hypothetical protein
MYPVDGRPRRGEVREEESVERTAPGEERNQLGAFGRRVLGVEHDQVASAGAPHLEAPVSQDQSHRS